MASQEITKIIVKNLPNNWTFEYLQDFLEAVLSITIAEDGVQIFPDINHTALLSLEEALSGEEFHEATQNLAQIPFIERILGLEAVTSSSNNNILIQYTDASLREEDFFLYFNNSQCSGCGDAEVLNCEVYPEAFIAVVQLSLPEAVDALIAKGNHLPKPASCVLKTELWCEQFHRPLLQQVLKTKSRQKISPFSAQSTPGIERISPFSFQNESIHSAPRPKGKPPDLVQTEIKCGSTSECGTAGSKQKPPIPAKGKVKLSEAAGYGIPGLKEILPVPVQTEIKCGSTSKYSTPGSKEKLSDSAQTQVKHSGAVVNGTPELKEISHAPALTQVKHHGAVVCGTPELKVISPAPAQTQVKPSGNGVYGTPELKERPHTPTQNEVKHSGAGDSFTPGNTYKTKSEPKDSEIDKLQKLMENLRLENQNLKSRTGNESIKEKVTVRFPIPSYQLRLLRDFAAQPREACKVILLEREGEALSTGTEEACEKAKRELLMYIQELAEDVLDLPQPISKILETAKGEQYVEDLIQQHPSCSAEICGSQLRFAALNEEHLAIFKTEFENNIVSKICKVPSKLMITQQFHALKMRMEHDYLVRLTVQEEGSGNLCLNGFDSDVELTLREVNKFVSENQSDTMQFNIGGCIQAAVCRKWFSKELDEVKQLIIKNGDLERESTDSGYSLWFQCRRQVVPDVLGRLNAIKNSITVLSIDLNKEFPVYHERALVINGLLNMGVRVFTSQFEEKLRQDHLESMGDFKLPARCLLPQPRLKSWVGTKGRERRKSRRSSQKTVDSEVKSGRRGSQYHTLSRHHRPPPPSLPFTLRLGSTNITVKSGDITEEQVDVAVNIVGKDLNLTKTAIGAAFLKKFPSLPQVLQTNKIPVLAVSGVHPVLETVCGGPPSMNVLFHAVLEKMNQDAVKKTVIQLVLQSLQKAVNRGATSIALPPFGVGKRFGHGRYTTASAMAAAFQQFFANSSVTPVTLQNVEVVVYDKHVAGKFAEVLKQKLGGMINSQPYPKPAAATVQATKDDIISEAEAAALPQTLTSEKESSSSDTDDGGDTTLLEEQYDLPELKDEKFEATICTARTKDCKVVVEKMLKELKTTFLWHETLRGENMDAFYKLDYGIISETLEEASKKTVHISIVERGLRLCGEKNKVHELLSDIHKRICKHLAWQTQHSSDKRALLKLPTDTNRIPSYWKRKRSAADSKSRASESKLVSVTKEERAAVERLVQATWESEKAGAGNDAKNLTHSSIKVTKVKRLENINLWEEYSIRRERYFQNLEQLHTVPSSALCTPVEKLSGSRGPVLTSAKIPGGSELQRDIYQQINEHYLFHGTKGDLVQKICDQGLDFRLSSSRTMLGSAVYAAESSTKADQYTDPKQKRIGEGAELTMILLRMILGEPFLHREQKPSPFKRPPCRGCLKRECVCVGVPLFDSVIDDVRLFREFSVYEHHVCYPEYFVTYQRK